MEEEKGLIKLALVQARTGGDARYYDCSISGWTFLHLYPHRGRAGHLCWGLGHGSPPQKRGRGRQRKEVKKEEEDQPEQLRKWAERVWSALTHLIYLKSLWPGRR